MIILPKTLKVRKKPPKPPITKSTGLKRYITDTGSTEAAYILCFKEIHILVLPTFYRSYTYCQ